jgi:hypothetical protein
MLTTNSNTTSTTNTTDGYSGYTLFMEGANHRGNFNKIRKVYRSVLKNVFRVKLKPQVGLEPCTECTLSTTKHGRYKHIYAYTHIHTQYTASPICILMYMFVHVYVVC